MSVDARHLEALEARRCAAISAGDIEALRAMLSDDYLHVHMTGHLDDRDGHLKAVASRPRRTERGPLAIRFYGEVAVLTGELTNHTTNAAGEVRTVRAYCHQVATRHEDGWRFVSIQLTPMAERS